MLNKLLHFRVKADLSAKVLAARVGVDSATLTAWERGNTPVPPQKLRKLAKILSATELQILGCHPELKSTNYEPKRKPELCHFGEVAIHFLGGGNPLLLSISDAMSFRLDCLLGSDFEWLIIESLTNQTVLVRKAAIAELHIACEAADEYGPGPSYPGHFEFFMPDPRDWEIVSALDMGYAAKSEAEQEHFDRVQSQILITDEQYEQLVDAGRIAVEDLAQEKEKNNVETQQIIDLASTVTYQLSNGVRRREAGIEASSLAEGFEEVLEGSLVRSAGRFFTFPVEGESRTVNLNAQAVDFVMLPSHLISQGFDEIGAKMIEETEALLNE